MNRSHWQGRSALDNGPIGDIPDREEADHPGLEEEKGLKAGHKHALKTLLQGIEMLSKMQDETLSARSKRKFVSKVTKDKKASAESNTQPCHVGALKPLAVCLHA